MQISHKTLAALLTVFLALLGAAALTLDHVMRPDFERLEAAERDRARDRVAANLAALGDDVYSKVTDYANWDATYAFAAGRAPHYADDLTDAWFDDYNIDLAIFVDRAGRILWNRRRDGAGGMVSETRSAAVLAAIARSTAGPSAAARGVEWIEGLGFVMLAASPILRSDGGGPEQGWVLLGRRISEAALREQAQINVELVSATSAPAELARRMERLVETPQQAWSSREETFTLSALYGMNGRIIGAALTRQAREITTLGARSIGFAFALFACSLALALTALWFGLRSLFLRRLIRLERHFDAQTPQLAPMPIARGADDEITSLTRAYNGLVDRLHDAAAREHAANVQREAEAVANRMKTSFLLNISHEIRQPLDAIIGYAELIEETLGDTGFDQADADLQRIVQAARQLLGLVHEVHDLARIEAHRLELTPEAFKVDEVMHDVVAALAPLLESRKTNLTVDNSGGLGAAYTDQKRLRQCLLNILASACRLSQDGIVTLSACRTWANRAERLRFEVRSRSADLSPERLSHMFEPFVQPDDASAGRFGDADLGLALTRKLAALLGGELEAVCAEDGALTYVLVVPALCDDPKFAAEIAA